MSFNSLTLQKDWFLELTNQSMAIIFAILVISMLIYSRTFTFQSTHQEYSNPDTSNDSYSSYRIQKGFSNTPFTGQNISTTQKFVFCNQCIANQNIVLNLLQNSEEESMEYKRSLEERYPPVCMDCEPNVSKTIHSINTSLFTSSPTKPPRKQVFTNADKFDDMPNQTESFQHTKNLQLSLERTNIHPIFKRTANITAGIGIAFLICLISLTEQLIIEKLAQNCLNYVSDENMNLFAFSDSVKQLLLQTSNFVCINSLYHFPFIYSIKVYDTKIDLGCLIVILVTSASIWILSLISYYQSSNSIFLNPHNPTYHFIRPVLTTLLLFSILLPLPVFIRLLTLLTLSKKLYNLSISSLNYFISTLINIILFITGKSQSKSKSMQLFRSLWDEHGYHSDISDYKHEQMDQFQNLNQLDSRSSLQNNVQKSKGLSFALKTLGISDQSDNIQNQPPLMQYTNTSIAEMDIDPPPLRLDTNINELRQIRLNPISRQQKPIIPDSNYFNQMFKKPSEMNEIQLKPQRLFPTPVETGLEEMFGSQMKLNDSNTKNTKDWTSWFMPQLKKSNK